MTFGLNRRRVVEATRTWTFSPLLQPTGFQPVVVESIGLGKIKPIKKWYYPKPATSQPGADHRVYPYLLHGMAVTVPDQVWSTDITHIRLTGGFVYLVAILDWYSRKVLAWRLSNTLETTFCVECLDEALAHRLPNDLQH